MTHGQCVVVMPRVAICAQISASILCCSMLVRIMMVRVRVQILCCILHECPQLMSADVVARIAMVSTVVIICTGWKATILNDSICICTRVVSERESYTSAFAATRQHHSTRGTQKTSK